VSDARDAAAALTIDSVVGAVLVVDGGPRAGRRSLRAAHVHGHVHEHAQAQMHDDDPRHGAFDDRALAVVNAAVGLPWPARALEVLLGPLRLRAHTALVVAACDGGTLTVDGVAQPPWSPVVVDAGAVVDVGAATGLRRTLAVRGAAGGASASAPGTALSRGDVVALKEPVDVDDAGIVVAAPPSAAERAGLASDVDGDGTRRVRVVAGPERAAFVDDAWRALLSTPWTVAPTSSRQGIRLTTTTTTTTPLPVPPGDGVTTGVWTGAVQVPPSGMPIVLGVDSRTTGGYPRLAHVIAVDRFVLAHARPGHTLRFVAVDVAEARALHRAFATRFRPVAPTAPAARATRATRATR
jgi:allophanate hydrolase subunit 2